MNKTARPSLSNPDTCTVSTGQEVASALLYTSADLFHGGDRIWIEHNGERYSLRITRQKKLILTK